MPATTSPADRLDLATGETIRTCTRCGFEGALTPENFFHRANGWVDRCQTCRRAVDAANRAARRRGDGVRSSGGRKFGVEIEFIGATNYALEAALRSRGLVANVEGYNHRTRPGWKIVTDASVSGGFELVSPPLRGRDGFEQLRKACEALAEVGARVSRSCGLHVHHEATDLSGADFGRLFRGWRANQPAIDGLVAPSRRQNVYCRPLSAAEVARVEQAPADARGIEGLRRHFSYADRFRTLNIEPFGRYGTVEVRQHQGSTSYEKIAAWVAFGQAMIAAAKSGHEVPVATDAPTLVAALPVPAAHAAVLRNRAAHFARRPAAAGR
jgi:hypothetical protein